MGTTQRKCGEELHIENKGKIQANFKLACVLPFILSPRISTPGKVFSKMSKLEVQRNSVNSLLYFFGGIKYSTRFITINCSKSL